MSEIFISYARSTEAQAHRIAEALRSLGYGVWRDDELPAHRAYSEVIEERLRGARAVVVVWSADAVKSEWVQSEADRARGDRKLVQLTVDGAALPMPFDRIQCADLAGWAGDTDAAGWRKVVASVVELLGESTPASEAATRPALALPSKPSIAVLPFANLSGDPEQEYFADGMVEEITTVLSRFRSLFVIGSASGLSFKGRTVAPQEAARQLGVRYVLEGSVRKGGGRVRIAVKLIDGADGAQIWADRFEDTLEDVFALQDRVALSVAGVIEPAVREAETRRVAARPTADLDAYELYLRALTLHRSHAARDVRAALGLLHSAIDLDLAYVPAMALAAYCHAVISVYGWSEGAEDHIGAARALVERAQDLARDDAESLTFLAAASILIGGDTARFAARALDLNPGLSRAWMMQGALQNLNNTPPEEARANLRAALRLDPLSPDEGFIVNALGLSHFRTKDYAEAAALIKQSIGIRSQWPLSRALLAATYGHMGELSAARAEIAAFRALTSTDVRTVGSIWPDRQLCKQVQDGIAIALAAGGEA